MNTDPDTPSSQGAGENANQGNDPSATADHGANPDSVSGSERNTITIVPVCAGPGGTESFMREMLLGGNIGAGNPAECYHVFDILKNGIIPADFSDPLGPLSSEGKGFSIMISHDSRQSSIKATLIAADLVRYCSNKAQGNSVNTLLALAANYDIDSEIGIVAVALETGKILTKPRTAKTIGLTLQEFSDLAKLVFAGNYADVVNVASREWGLSLKEGVTFPPAIKSRGKWREELGHDVLINPLTLEPCKTDEGEILAFEGVKIAGTENNMTMSFAFRTQNGSAIESPGFLPVALPAAA